MEHRPALPYGKYFTDGLPDAVETSWNRVTADAMLKQCLHPYHTQGNEACNNSFTNCKQPKSRCQYAGTPLENFRGANFVLRHATGLRVGHVGGNKSRKYIVRWQGYAADDTTEEPARKF